MNLIEVMSSINKYGRHFVLLVVLANLFSVSYADATTSIESALEGLCSASTLFLSAAVVIMIILAGAIYAIGQIMGAETRARASVWATAMLTGAVIAALIYLLVPYILNMLLPSGYSISPDSPCDFSAV